MDGGSSDVVAVALGHPAVDGLSFVPGKLCFLGIASPDSLVRT